MRKLREHAAEISEISRNLLGLETYLQLCGNRELKLENCRKVLEYNEIRIVVQTTELILEIWGRNLEADSRTPECLWIHGEIQSISLTLKGGRHGTAAAR